MKKTLLLMMFAIVTMCGYAQNANRSGIFLEIGAGGTIGDSPATEIHTSLAVNDGKLIEAVTIKRDTGIKFNIATGYRYAVSNNWAIEMKATGVKYNDFVLKLMPGARYTSKELFSNVSMYIAPNIGISYDFGAEYDPCGLAFNLGVGLNLTERIYVGVNFEGQYYFEESYLSFDYNGYGNDYYKFDKYAAYQYRGTIGLNIGYRF